MRSRCRGHFNELRRATNTQAVSLYRARRRALLPAETKLGILPKVKPPSAQRVLHDDVTKLLVTAKPGVCGTCGTPLRPDRTPPDPLATTIGYAPAVAYVALGWVIITERPEHLGCRQKDEPQESDVLAVRLRYDD